MSGNYFTNPLIFLITALVEIYLIVLVLKVLLQITRADFYNPISQFVMKVTQPILKPMQTLFPSVARVDLAAIFLMLVLQCCVSYLQLPGGSLLAVLMLSIASLISLTINVFMFSIFVIVLLSWISPGTYNPAISLLHSLTRPILEPIQKRIPDLGGLDLSPLVALLGLQVLKMLLIPPFYALANSVA